MMTEDVDFFFSPYPSAQEKRLQAALRVGLAHGSRIEPGDPEPGQEVTLLFYTNARFKVEQVAVYYTSDGSDPIGMRGQVLLGAMLLAEAGEVVSDQRLEQRVQIWRVVLPGQVEGTQVRYRADAWGEGYHCFADEVDPISIPYGNGRSFAYHVDRFRTPDWWQDAVVYQIFVDRFSAAKDEPPLLRHDQSEITGFFGGTLNGVREKLEYIQALGINCIWLSPIFESPSHHGYNLSDFHSVARRFGGNQALEQLVEEAHARGIRILLDFVANHTSNEHAAFLTAYADPSSPSAAWYSFENGRPDSYRGYAGVKDMPQLQTDHPEVQHYLNEAALYWLEQFGADGLRLDYVPGPSHAFWSRYQAAVKTRMPEAYTIGEITGLLEDIATYAGRMDGFMDFPLARGLREAFAERKTTLAAFLAYLEQRKSELPVGMSRGTLLDNHDAHRFLWLAQNRQERLKLAAACQFTLEGTPIIYYGTEVGLSQYDDARLENAHARAPMLWGREQDRGLLAYYHQLVQVRRQQPVLRSGEHMNVPCELVEGLGANAEQVGAYLRYQDGKYLLIVLNNNEQSVQVRIQLAESLREIGIVEGSGLEILFPQPKEIGMEQGMVVLELEAVSALISVPVEQKA